MEKFTEFVLISSIASIYASTLFFQKKNIDAKIVIYRWIRHTKCFLLSIENSILAKENEKRKKKWKSILLLCARWREATETREMKNDEIRKKWRHFPQEEIWLRVFIFIFNSSARNVRVRFFLAYFISLYADDCYYVSFLLCNHVVDA